MYTFGYSVGFMPNFLCGFSRSVIMIYKDILHAEHQVKVQANLVYIRSSVLFLHDVLVILLPKCSVIICLSEFKKVRHT